MSTISNGTDTVTPLAITDYQSTRGVANVVHDIIGRADPDVTLRVAKTRNGSLELIFTDAAASLTAQNLIAESGVMTLSDPDVETVDMAFVVADTGVSRTLDPTRSVWLVTFGYREVVV